MLLALTNLIRQKPWHLAAVALWVLTLIAAYRAGYRAGVNSIELPATISAQSTAKAVTTASTEIKCPITVVTVPANTPPGTRYDTSVPVTAAVTSSTTLTTSMTTAEPPYRPPGKTERGLNTLSLSWAYGQEPTDIRSYRLTYERYLMYGISSHLTYTALDRTIAFGLGLSF